MYQLGIRSLSNLTGVHPDLIRVVHRAIQLTKQDFTVIEGMRTKSRQEELFKKGASKTLNSRHLTGHAVDIAPWVDGAISWDWKYYPAVRDAMMAAGEEFKIPLEWGGSWKRFTDGPHWQLPWSEYPL